MKKLNQKGFGIVEGLLIFVAVALIAGTGYYVYKQSQNNDKAQSSVEVANKKEAVVTPPTKTSTTKADPYDGYVVIKEWGIKIKLADADKVTYSMSGTPNGAANADSTTSYATLRLNESVGTKDACRPLGFSIVQTTATTSGTQVGKYYYGFEGGEPTACGDSKADALRSKIVTTELVNSAISVK